MGEVNLKTRQPVWRVFTGRSIERHTFIDLCSVLWHFSPEQQQVLQRYYDANQWLLDCLNSRCEVTDAVRQEIEAALLLPQKELEDREW